MNKNMRKMYTEEDVSKISVDTIKQVPSGTINKVIGLNTSGKLIKGTISGGTQLYEHFLTLETNDGDMIDVHIISKRSTEYTRIQYFKADEGKILVASSTCTMADSLGLNFYPMMLDYTNTNIELIGYTTNGVSMLTIVGISSDSVSPL